MLSVHAVPYLLRGLGYVIRLPSPSKKPASQAASASVICCVVSGLSQYLPPTCYWYYTVWFPVKRQEPGLSLSTSGGPGRSRTFISSLLRREPLPIGLQAHLVRSAGLEPATTTFSTLRVYLIAPCPQVGRG